MSSIKNRALSLILISILLIEVKCFKTETIVNEIKSSDENCNLTFGRLTSLMQVTDSFVTNSTPNYFPQFEESMEEMGCGFGFPPNVAKLVEEVHDSESQFGQYSWVVRISNGNEQSLIGSGALLAPDIVLTTTVLLKGRQPSDLIVVAGEWDVDSLEEGIPHQVREVETIIRHDSGIFNAIGLLVLSMSFKLQPNIRTICLPPPEAVYDDVSCKTIAWQLAKSSRPIETDFIIQSRSKCKQLLPLEFLDRAKELHPSHLCALRGDSRKPVIANLGSALFCPMRGNPHRYTQVGIFILTTSRGVTSGTGLFVNVAHLMPWIFQQLGPRNTDLKYYLP